MATRQRRSIRLAGYDYASAGAYFVTLCTHNRECIFGSVSEDRMELNDLGRIVVHEWQRSDCIRREIELDELVVMPNHVHGIVWITDLRHDAIGTVGATGRSPLPVVGPPRDGRPRGPASRSLAAFVGGWKSAVTARVNALRSTPGQPVWQRNYFEHIIRDNHALARLRRYIADNPRVWQQDAHYPGSS
jgi:REP element-mobilizing transposase RayT